MEMKHSKSIQKIAFIGNHIPRRCGIATFTADICAAISLQNPHKDCFTIAVNDIPEGYEYPDVVRFEIIEKDIDSYQRAAEYVNFNNVDVVSLQHEFGIFGGPSGNHILSLLKDLNPPLVTTLHTILTEPTLEQRDVMAEIARITSRFIVMTKQGLRILRDTYKVPESNIDVIPHGIPDMPFVDPNFYKDSFGVEGKLVLFTFGLLSPNKGIDFVLNALPRVLEKFPNLVYIVLGATHPNLVRMEGEAYRLRLERLALRLGIEKNVIFYNRYVELDKLIEFICSSDIYITPYLTETQIVSGTLAYSFGAGKAVISTPYWHAKELLADNRGVLVPFSDSSAISKAITDLLTNDVLRHGMRKNAYKLGRKMIWSSVANQYLQSFEKSRVTRRVLPFSQLSVKTLAEQGTNLPKLKFDHLHTMMDTIGMFQHALYSIPNFIDGYCTDDNARCLILTVLLEKLDLQDKELNSIASRCMAFLNYAYNEKKGRFRNFMSFERTWTEQIGSEDSHGRAMWALGTCIGRSNKPNLQKMAIRLWENTIKTTPNLNSPRSRAFTLIGISEYLKRLRGDSYATHLRDILVNQLLREFTQCASDDWVWFEDVVSYSNAKIPHALILSARDSNHEEALDIGLKSLRWLLSIQKTKDNFFRPIGCHGFFKRDHRQAIFDQQPIEIYSMVSACIDTYLITEDAFWLKEAQIVFDWFLGRNDLGLMVYDPETGGCRDAIQVDSINGNQGAESTLSFLLSLAEMQILQNKKVSFMSERKERVLN